MSISTKGVRKARPQQLGVDSLLLIFVDKLLISVMIFQSFTSLNVHNKKLFKPNVLLVDPLFNTILKLGLSRRVYWSG